MLGTAAAAALSARNARAEDTTLVISMWGFNGDKLRQHLFAPFEQAHSVKILIDEGNAGDRLNKVKIRGGGADLIYLSDIFSQIGIHDGVFEKIDAAALPNLAQLYPIARAPQGEGWGPAYTLGRVGVVYDGAKVNPGISTWKDLWKPAFRNHLTIPGYPTTAGPVNVLIAAKVAGVDAYADPKAAFASLAALKPNVVKSYSTGSELVNLFSTGEVVAAIAQDFTFASIKKAIPTAIWADLSDGAFASFNTVNLVRGTKNRALALAFIDWHLSAPVQQALAIAGTDAPANMTVKLTPEQAAPWTYGERVIGALNQVDYARMLAAKADWADRWNDVFAA